MSKLSDTQLAILSNASQRPDRCILPLPDRLKGGAAGKVVESLIAKGMVEEVDANRGDLVWRQTGDGHGVTLVATDAALAALNIEPPQNRAQAEHIPAATNNGALIEDASADQGAVTAMGESKTARAKQRNPRADSKQAQLITLLQRDQGATIPELVEALGWQQHTVRGAIAGALKKKLGFEIISEKGEGRGRVYRIAG